MVGRDVPTLDVGGPTMPFHATRFPHPAPLGSTLDLCFSFFAVAALIPIVPLRSPRNAEMVERLGDYREK